LGEGAGSAPVRSTSAASSASAASSGGASYKPNALQNTVRILDNSQLGVDKLTITQTGGPDVVTDTQLDLKAGRVMGNVKKMSSASRYEVKLPNGVAAILAPSYSLTSH